MRKRWVLAGGAVGAALFVLLAPVLIVCALAPFNGRVGAGTAFAGSALLDVPPEPLEKPVTLKLATYNIANAYLFTFNRPERMRGIARKLIELDPDLVALQEAFIKRNRKILYGELADSRLKYHVRFPSATLGNGLLILSAFPIAEAYFYRYTRAGKWWKVWEGDWWAGKGVGLARVRLPGGGCIDFYNTHAQAPRRNNPYNVSVRASQMRELAAFINASRCKTAPAFLAGDLNTTPKNGDYQRLRQEAGLVRVMDLPSHIDHVFAADSPHYRFQVLGTVEISGRIQGSEAAVFLVKPPTWEEFKKMVLRPAEQTPLSDHPGYMTTVRVLPAAKQP